MTKQEIRRKILGERRKMDPAAWRMDSERIAEHVIQHRSFLDAEDIYCYVAAKGEADTTKIMETAWRQGKCVWVPKVFRDARGSGEMDFFRIHSFRELSEGSYGILEPEDDGCPAKGRHGLMILPGIAYDNCGHRLGYGGGYYDRYLTRHQGLDRMGIAFGYQLVDELPVEEHDQRIHWLITENGTMEYTRW